jgi:hypothetical protein
MYGKIFRLTGRAQFKASAMKWLEYFVAWWRCEGRHQRLTDLSLLTGVFGQSSSQVLIMSRSVKAQLVSARSSRSKSAAGYGYPRNREPGVSLRRVLYLPSAP